MHAELCRLHPLCTRQTHCYACWCIVRHKPWRMRLHRKYKLSRVQIEDYRMCACRGATVIRGVVVGKLRVNTRPRAGHTRKRNGLASTYQPFGIACLDGCSPCKPNRRELILRHDRHRELGDVQEQCRRFKDNSQQRGLVWSLKSERQDNGATRPSSGY